MSNNTRRSANLVSEANIFSDITNNRVGIGTTVLTAKLTVNGDVNISGVLTASSISGSIDASDLVFSNEEQDPVAFSYLAINTNKSEANYGQLSFTRVIRPVSDINIFELDIYADYIGPGSFSVNSDGFLILTL